MGKNWKGRGGGGGGGGGNSDLSSSRGFAAVLGTCDAAREKESNKELSNLLNQAIEKLYPVPAEKPSDNTDEGEKEQSIAEMLQNELKSLQKQKHSNSQDIVTINTGIKGIVFAKISRRDVCPVKLIKSIMDQVKEDKVPCSRHLVKIVPLQLVYFAGEEDFISSAKILVEGSFQSENETTTLSKIALSKVVHNKRKAEELIAASAEAAAISANSSSEGINQGESEDKDSKRVCIEHNSESNTSTSATQGVNGDDQASAAASADPVAVVPEIEVSPETETVPASSPSPAPPVSTIPVIAKPEARYFIIFKARNHNTLNKQMVIQRVREVMPVNMRQDYMNGENAVFVEALKNIAGISYFPDYYNYSDLNLRKHQAEHCPQVSSTMLHTTNASAKTDTENSAHVNSTASGAEEEVACKQD